MPWGSPSNCCLLTPLVLRWWMNEENLSGSSVSSTSFAPSKPKKDLNQLTAEDVMAKTHLGYKEQGIDEAVKIMEEKRLLNLPVIVNGKVAYSITRHDLLRAWIGLGMDIETNMA